MSVCGEESPPKGCCFKATEDARLWSAVLRSGLAALFVMNLSQQQLFSSSGCSSGVDMHFLHNVKISCVSG